MVRRIFLILAVVALIAVMMASGPAALAKKGKARGKPKVTLCHEGQTIVVGAPAARAHLAQHEGDTLGPCPTV